MSETRSHPPASLVRTVAQTAARIWRHRWMDAGDTRRAVPPDVADRLRQRIAASERRHGGEIRICVESSLPASYLWRHVRQRVPMPDLVRQRALMMFSKLRVWDTEGNNGVLIYLLLAEHAIELVADRGVALRAGVDGWRGVVAHLGAHLRRGGMEDGLTQALEEVSAVLVEHFPLPEGAPPPAGDGQLPNDVTLC